MSAESEDAAERAEILAAVIREGFPRLLDDDELAFLRARAGNPPPWIGEGQRRGVIAADTLSGRLAQVSVLRSRLWALLTSRMAVSEHEFGPFSGSAEPTDETDSTIPKTAK